MKEEDLFHGILFLDADDETLVRRYKETRRSHPYLQWITIRRN